MLKTDAIGRHLQYILKKCNAPADYDDEKKGFGVEIFQMPVPGESHKQIGKNQ